MCFVCLLVEKCKCYNPKFRFVTKTRAYKGAGQKGSLGVTFHALGV